MNDNAASDFKQWGINNFAYVNGLKQIPDSNPPAFSIKVCMPYGRAGSKNYVYADLVIKELNAFMLLNQYQQQINDEDSKVSIQFNCYNLHPRPFLYFDAKGKVVMADGNPKLGVSMRGYLSSVSRLKIGNDVVYQYEERKQQPPATSETEDKKVSKLPRKAAAKTA